MTSEVSNLAVIMRGDVLSQLARPAGSLHHKTRNRTRCSGFFFFLNEYISIPVAITLKTVHLRYPKYLLHCTRCSVNRRVPPRRNWVQASPIWHLSHPAVFVSWHRTASKCLQDVPWTSTTTSTFTASLDPSISQHLRAAKEILQRVVFGVRWDREVS